MEQQHKHVCGDCDYNAKAWSNSIKKAAEIRIALEGKLKMAEDMLVRMLARAIKAEEKLEVIIKSNPYAIVAYRQEITTKSLEARLEIAKAGFNKILIDGCGCLPCRGDCDSNESVQVKLEYIKELADDTLMKLEEK